MCIRDSTYTIGRREGVYLPAGATVGGELAFLPSAAPLAARAAADLQLCPTSPGEQPVAGDLDQAIAAYAAALAANPWLRVYPLALAHVTLEPPATAASTWRVRDGGGRWLDVYKRQDDGLARGGVALDAARRCAGRIAPLKESNTDYAGRSAA